MSKQEVEYEGTVHCSTIRESVTVLIGRRISDYGHTEGSFVKVLCPYFYQGPFGMNKCSEGGKCGIAEGASN